MWELQDWCQVLWWVEVACFGPRQRKMPAPGEQKEVGIETLEDLDRGKLWRFNQKTGETARCNARGDPIARFHQDFTGFATTEARKARGMQLEVGFTFDPPAHLGIPTKYVGYATLPRPGLNSNAKGSECSFALPKYLEPVPPKLGRISTTRNTGPKKRVPRNQHLPTFLETLDTQFSDSLSMTRFSDLEFPKIRSANDVEATAARNRQMVQSDGYDLLEELRKLRPPNGVGVRFAVKEPPFNARQIREKEEVRDRLVNAGKWKIEDHSRLADRAAVEKRRRDRYLQHFLAKEEQERALQAQTGGSERNQRRSILEIDSKAEEDEPPAEKPAEGTAEA